MKFANYARYVNDERAVSNIRPRHQEYLSRLLADGELVTGGPLTDGGGVLFIYEADSLRAATATLSADPYLAGGALASYELQSWEAVSANLTSRAPQMRAATEGTDMHGGAALAPEPITRTVGAP